MTNPENITNHNRHPEKKRAASAKGGRANTLCNRLSKRKWCNSGCPLFPCYFQGMSKSKFRDDKTGKYLCALKEFPERVQRRTLDLYTGGESGFDKQMVENMISLGVKADRDGSSKEERAYLRDLIDTKKSIFGDKQRIEATVSEVTDEDFRKTYNEMMEEKKKKK